MAKGILVTALNKSQNPEFFKNDSVGERVRKNLPSNYHGVELLNAGGYHTRTDLHLLDGFKDIVTPTYNPLSEKVTSEIIDNANDENTFIYAVIDKTEQEIQNEALANAELNRQLSIQEKLENDVMVEAQGSDDTSALDNQSLFPIWEVGFAYEVDFKVQHFTAENELVLYKCVQAHTSQSDWQPKDVPALFTRVAYPNEIPVFVQPTGAQDAYQTGDQVYFPTENDDIYESLIDANVWSPITYPQGWQLIS